MLKLLLQYKNQRMYISNGTRIQNDNSHNSNSLESDNNSDLKWLGDLLDPWRGVNTNQGTHLKSLLPPVYNNIVGESRSQNGLSSQTQELVHTSAYFGNRSNRAQTPNISNQSSPILISDEEEESPQCIPTSNNLNCVQSVILQKDTSLHKSPRQGLQKMDDAQQKEASISFSMLFEHSNSNVEYQSPVNYKQALQICKIFERMDQPQNKQRSQKMQFQEQETHQATNPNNQDLLNLYQHSRRKKIQKKLKILSKKRTVHPNDLIELMADSTLPQNHSQNLSEEDKKSINMEKFLKVQQAKVVQSFDSAEEILVVASNHEQVPQFHVQADANDQVIQAHQSHQLQSSSMKSVTDSNQQHDNQELTINRNQPITHRNIVSSISEKPPTPKQKQIANEFDSIIRIVNDRQILNDKEYKWEIGTERSWKTITDALNFNFYSFVRHAKKYKSKFMKYLPKKVVSKKEGHNKLQGKLNGQSTNSTIKLERIQQAKIKAKSREMANLKNIFDKVQLSKVIEYQKYLEEKDEIQDEFEDALFTEYEPSTPQIGQIIEEIVTHTNNTIRNKKIKRNQPLNTVEQGKAMNQMLIHNLSQATDDYNYISSMKKLFNFTKKQPILSCLMNDGLGLRSNDLKVIDKATFQAEVKKSKKMSSPIILNDVEPSHTQEANLKSESEKNLTKMKIQ